MVIIVQDTTETKRRRNLRKSFRAVVKLKEEEDGVDTSNLEQSAATVSAIHFSNLDTMMNMRSELDSDDDYSDYDDDRSKTASASNIFSLPGVVARARSVNLRFRIHSASSSGSSV